MAEEQQMVTVTVDGVEVTVPKGANLIEVAKKAGIEVPHYCYHEHLSIAGNCRMCQVKVEGMPKLTIACNTTATDGMKISTHRTSEEVAEAQRAVLEFLLINHPLDCTVCDQAGHCKLQDFYYAYDAESSRFIEEKEHHEKAEVLGPEVIYDGERCIVCTRCVRFCDEVTQTSELGVFNRGDRSIIGVYPGRELNNPFSGTVCDLCPVGALTHRRWRFNTRIWFTTRKKSICPGCSTGCNTEVAVRDGNVVHVKARLNSDVNKEWLCDEGRYGFERFQPHERLTGSLQRVGDSYQAIELENAIEQATKLADSTTSKAIFLSPFLTTEELWVSLRFVKTVLGLAESSDSIAMPVKLRELTDLQAKLISPDYAPNARAVSLLGVVPQTEKWREQLAQRYQALCETVRAGKIDTVFIIGDYAVLNQDLDEKFVSAVRNAVVSVQIGTRTVQSAQGDDVLLGTRAIANLVLPGRTVNEKTGVLINRDQRAQRLVQILEAPAKTVSDWQLIKQIAEKAKRDLGLGTVQDERALYRAMAADVKAFGEITLMAIGDQGVNLK